ncbi:MAG TPA: C13 family peptidase [Stellaceae bacterium]|nr:C13 family peptidase [Stellaceae bacterium]
MAMPGLARLGTILGRFVRNFAASLCLILPVPVRRSWFRIGPGQAVLMMALAILTQVGCHYVDEGGGVLWTYGLGDLGTGYLIALLGCWIAARIAEPAEGVAAIAVLVFGADTWLGPMLVAGSAAVQQLPERTVEWASVGWYWMGLVWYVAALFRAVWVAAGRIRSWRLGAGWACVAAGLIAPSWTVFPVELWYPAQTGEAETVPSINVEDTFSRQPGLVAHALAAIEPSRSGGGSLYFLGFASYAGQDVFLKEGRSAKALFDERFGTRGRSLLLVNNPKTVDDTPIASVHNLAAALHGLAKRMDVEHDILFLYLTSHGSREELAVQFQPLWLNDLTPEGLRRMLDDAGIRWRVIAISSCYSGSFIPALKDPQTVIMTAASADRTSFGCSNENDFTYFGEALIGQALRQQRSFIEAFHTAAGTIAEREKREGLTPSQPQIFVGDAMPDRLSALEKDLQAVQPGD